MNSELFKKTSIWPLWQKKLTVHEQEMLLFRLDHQWGSALYLEMARIIPFSADCISLFFDMDGECYDWIYDIHIPSALVSLLDVGHSFKPMYIYDLLSVLNAFPNNSLIIDYLNLKINAISVFNSVIFFWENKHLAIRTLPQGYEKVLHMLTINGIELLEDSEEYVLSKFDKLESVLLMKIMGYDDAIIDKIVQEITPQEWDNIPIGILKTFMRKNLPLLPSLPNDAFLQRMLKTDFDFCFKNSIFMPEVAYFLLNNGHRMDVYRAFDSAYKLQTGVNLTDKRLYKYLALQCGIALKDVESAFKSKKEVVKMGLLQNVFPMDLSPVTSDEIHLIL